MLEFRAEDAVQPYGKAIFMLSCYIAPTDVDNILRSDDDRTGKYAYLGFLTRHIETLSQYAT